MLVSSFLCKHLLIDWRWGEAYFAKSFLIMKNQATSEIGNGLQDVVWMLPIF